MSAVPRVDWRENRGFQQILSLLVEIVSIKSPTMAEQEEKIPTIAEDIVVTKYKMAAEIVNRT